MIRRAIVAMVSLILTAVPVLAGQQPATGQFLPANDLPPDQKLPAAPFLIGAYAFIWLALMFYLWTIWRRLGKVEKEMRVLDERQRSHAR
jgi:CcmD family protein